MQTQPTIQLEQGIYWSSLASPGETFDIVAEAVGRFERLSMTRSKEGWQITAEGIVYQPLSPVSGVLRRDDSSAAITASFLRCYRLHNQVMVLSLEDGHRILIGDLSAERLARRHRCSVSEAQEALLVAGVLDGHRIPAGIVHRRLGKSLWIKQ